MVAPLTAASPSSWPRSQDDSQPGGGDPEPTSLILRVPRSSYGASRPSLSRKQAGLRPRVLPFSPGRLFLLFESHSFCQKTI